MKVNVFEVQPRGIAQLREKLEAVGMEVIRNVDQDGWQGDFYYSADANPREPAWVASFREYFDDRPIPESHSPFAVFLFVKGDRSYAVTYGKSHFFVRPFCNYDFGVELAKRIAQEEDTRLTASKRFSGRQRKAIRAYSKATSFNIESGESVDYVQAAVLDELVDDFGTIGKFGTSAQLSVDIRAGAIGGLLTKIDAHVSEEPRFRLPRTTLITDETEVSRLDEQLLNQLQSPSGTTDFTENSYDLYGVDFVFGSVGRYTIKYGRMRQEVDQLTVRDLKEFIAANAIPREGILNIKITHRQDDGPTYTNELKRELDFIADDERVVLADGRWMRFNQDYLDFLDQYLMGIDVEVTEEQFAEIWLSEGEFNSSSEIANAGYKVADKDFSIFKTRSKTPIEAWDLQRAGTVYAVKFGTAQKLGYVCDQAMAVLELLRNKANVRKIPEFDSYCLWLGYRSQKLPDSIADTGSIILKQKIEAWARKTEELKIRPVLKLSKPLRRGVDDKNIPAAGAPA